MLESHESSSCLTGLVPLTSMYILNLIYQTVVGLFKQAWLFPHFIAIAIKKRRRQFALNLLEVERLDRIRNPSKYLGR